MGNEEVKEIWEDYWAKNRDGELQLDEMSKTVLSDLSGICGELEGKKVLEAGCGRGIISAGLAELGADVYLMDVSKEALSIARKNFEDRSLSAYFIHGDILDLPFGRSTFDVVWNAGVMEHFEAVPQSKALEGISRIIKPGGLFVSFNPNTGAYFYRLGKKSAEQKGKWPYGPEFPVSSLKEQCEKAGLTVLREYPICFKENLSYLSYISKHLRSVLKVIFKPFPDKAMMKIFGGYLLVTVSVKQK